MDVTVMVQRSCLLEPRNRVGKLSTDGGAMTSSSCVNPSLTYMTLTARACDYAVQQLKKGDL